MRLKRQSIARFADLSEDDCSPLFFVVVATWKKLSAKGARKRPKVAGLQRRVCLDVIEKYPGRRGSMRDGD